MVINNLRRLLSIPVLFLILNSCESNTQGNFVVSSKQFINSSFEQRSEKYVPANWKLIPTEEYAVVQDGGVKRQGSYSLRISGRTSNPSTGINVSQKVPISYKSLKRIRVTAYIRTNQLKGNVLLWYNTFDINNKEIDFGNSESSGTIAVGTNEWQKYAIDIVLNKDASILNFGGYVRGSGTVWFDDFAIEEYQGGGNEPALEVSRLNTEFIDIVKKKSIYKDSVDWKSVNEDLQILGKGLKTPGDALILNSYVLQQLRKAGDNHSFVQSKIAAETYTSGKVKQPVPEAKILENGIGYVSVPAFGSVNREAMEEFASNIQSGIRKLDSQNEIKGWIVDLRTNSGGNMFSMISGLGPLLDIGELGYFIIGGVITPWNLKENGMNVNVKEPYRVKSKENKIAVLIGSKTGSSGEMTAISFIGQHNTKLFGEPSGGYTTSNQMFKLSNGSNLVLATGYVADRNHKKYLGSINPDVTIKAVAGQDAVMRTAKSWILDKE